MSTMIEPAFRSARLHERISLLVLNAQTSSIEADAAADAILAMLEEQPVCAGPRPHEANPGQTHYLGCWQERGHHNCAVDLVRALAGDRHVALDPAVRDDRLRAVHQLVDEVGDCGPGAELAAKVRLALSGTL